MFWRPNGGGDPVRVTDSENKPSEAAVALRFFQTNPE
jgi:hypothetical protein